MRLYEVQATEYNGNQEYSQSRLLAAENVDRAWQIARDYFRKWYDDGDEPQGHDADKPDEFEFFGGRIRLKITGIQEITLDAWVKKQIRSQSISDLPETVLETDLTRAAKCAIADLEGYLEDIDIPRDDPEHPAALTRRELLAGLADFKAVSPAYCAAAEYLAEQGRHIFTGPMTGGLWNGRILDACIMSNREGDKAAYEFLLKFGDRYASTLPAEQQQQWQNLKDNAADMLK